MYADQATAGTDAGAESFLSFMIIIELDIMLCTCSNIFRKGSSYVAVMFAVLEQRILLCIIVLVCMRERERAVLCKRDGDICVSFLTEPCCVSLPLREGSPFCFIVRWPPVCLYVHKPDLLKYIWRKSSCGGNLWDRWHNIHQTHAFLKNSSNPAHRPLTYMSLSLVVLCYFIVIFSELSIIETMQRSGCLNL